MPVQCAKCGEELLGSVNRCWKCGTEFASRPGPSNTPPVRRSPLSPSTINPVVAVAVTARSADANADSADLDKEQPAPPTGESVESAKSRRELRTGSPFAGSVRPSAMAATATNSSAQVRRVPLAPVYPRNAAARGGAIAAFVVGLLAFAFSFFTVAALVVAVLGMGMGVWGLHSDRRGMAMIGVLLCCLAIGISGYNGVVELYVRTYGISPWDEASGALDYPID